MRNKKSEGEILSPLEWYTVQRKVSELIPCDFNPRTISEEELERLKKSLEKFNLVEIPVIDFDGVLLAGHQRVGVLYTLERGEDINIRATNVNDFVDDLVKYKHIEITQTMGLN